VFFLLVQVTVGVTAGRKVKRGGRRSRHPCFFQVFQRRRVKGCAATVPAPINPAEHYSGLQKVFPVNSRLFWGCYCNFNVFIVYLFWIFILYCGCKKKRKRKEKKKYSKEMCVCLYFLCILLNQKEKNEFNILIYMRKYLKYR